MKQELIEIKTSDGITLDGIFFMPSKRSHKTVIHVHGLSDNFYQKRFIRVLAGMFVNMGYNYLSFNNRGHDYCNKLLKNGKKISGGSYCESFVESALDIEAAIRYVEEMGTEEIILEGHSLGCSKVVYYYNENPHPMIKKMILLSPCDGIMKVKQIMGDSYYDYLQKAEEEIGKEKPDTVLVNQEMFPQTYTAWSFATNYVEESSLDIFRYRDKNYVCELLRKIKIPILIIIGTKDKMAFISEEDDITPFFKNNLTTEYKIQFIPEANHNYDNMENNLSDVICDWIK